MTLCRLPHLSAFIFAICFIQMFTLHAQWVQKGMDIENGTPYGAFGRAMDISANGNIVVCGESHNDSSLFNSGRVQIYQWAGMAWTQRGSDIYGENMHDLAGANVAISSDGNIVAAYAPYNGPINNGTSFKKGQVRIFEWNGTDWMQLGNSLIGDTISDFFGHQLSLAGDGRTVAISSFKVGSNDEESLGQLTVYRWNSSVWERLGSDFIGDSTHASLGSSVSLSHDGNTVAFGISRGDLLGANIGFSQVHVWNGNNWEQKGVNIEGSVPFDVFGESMDISYGGDTLIIWAAQKDSVSASFPVGPGYARVYAWTGSSWGQLGSDISGDVIGEVITSSTSISGDGRTIAIGVTGHHVIDSLRAGHARVFYWNETDWVQCGENFNPADSLAFSGAPVRLSANGKTMAVSASYNSNFGIVFNSKVEVYELLNNTEADVPIMNATSQLVCPGSPVEISVSSTSQLNDAELWYLYTGNCLGQAVDSNLIGVFSVIPDSTTNYYVKGKGEVCTKPGGCGTVHVEITPTYLINRTVNVCPRSTFIFPDGTSQNNIVSPMVQESMIFNPLGCDTLIKTMVNVNNIDISVTQKENELISNDQEAVSYQWIDCESGLEIFEANQKEYSPEKDGIYAVVVTSNNCIDTSDCHTFCLPPCANFYIPNIFSPDGDGINDELQPLGKGVKQFTLKIYDRWGTTVFISTEMSFGWDGTYKGKSLPVGVYAYFVNGEYDSGTIFSEKCNVTIVR